MTFSNAAMLVAVVLIGIAVWAFFPDTSQQPRNCMTGSVEGLFMNCHKNQGPSHG